MSYIQQALSENEEITYSTRVSLWSCLKDFLCIIVFSYFVYALLQAATDPVMPALVDQQHTQETWYAGLAIIPVVLYFISGIIIAYYGTELGITNRRVIAKTGIIRRETFEISLSKVESIRIEQSILGRIFNYGTLVVSGTGSSHAPLKGIDDPLMFRKKFDEMSGKLPA